MGQSKGNLDSVVRTGEEEEEEEEEGLGRKSCSYWYIIRSRVVSRRYALMIALQMASY